MSCQEVPALQLDNVRLYFRRERGFFNRKATVVRAVDGVSFDIDQGKTLAVVGESGSGKTTLGRVIVRLLEETHGRILFKGIKLDSNQIKVRNVRQKIQMIFQDSFSALNPRKTIFQSLSLALRLYDPDLDRHAIESKILTSLEAIGLVPPEQYLLRYPHELSGGQRQRICIMRAMTPEPELVVSDEPVSALDVSIRSQVLSLLKDFQASLKFTHVFITHDLSVAKIMADDTIVMYCGKVMEYSDVNELYTNPEHPYTKTFLSAIPNPDPKMRAERIILTGDPPSPSNPPPGCRFDTRCPYVVDRCSKEEPQLIDIGNKHFVRCHLLGG